MTPPLDSRDAETARLRTEVARMRSETSKDLDISMRALDEVERLRKEIQRKDEALRLAMTTMEIHGGLRRKLYRQVPVLGTYRQNYESYVNPVYQEVEKALSPAPAGPTDGERCDVPRGVNPPFSVRRLGQGAWLVKDRVGDDVAPADSEEAANWVCRALNEAAHAGVKYAAT